MPVALIRRHLLPQVIGPGAVFQHREPPDLIVRATDRQHTIQLALLRGAQRDARPPIVISGELSRGQGGEGEQGEHGGQEATPDAGRRANRS
jgi:hypothetical protein